MQGHFYINELRKRYDYDDLLRDVGQARSVSTAIQHGDYYRLYVDLLSALRIGAPALLAHEGLSREELTTLGAETYTIVQAPPAPDKFGLPEIQDACRRSPSQVGILTSGSAGRPKLVLHAVASLLRSTRVHAGHAQDVWGLAYHPVHFAGLQVFFQALMNGNPLVQIHGLEPRDARRAILDFPMTHLSATPTFYRMICTRDFVCPSVRRVSSGGERFDPRLAEIIRHSFPQAKIQNIYASTEAGSLLVSDGDCFVVPEELSGLVRVIDGQLAIHRSLLAASLQQQAHEEFYMTGDCVHVEQHDPLAVRFVHRQSEIINVGGSKVNPAEVEEHLHRMGEVSEACVYGIANSVTGFVVGCDIVLKPGQQLTARDIRQRLEAALLPHKIPRVIRFVATLPVTNTGKRARFPAAASDREVYTG
jgi:acyl-coenzyme A synthetase/AMP-(fatty) acid ligase